MQMTFKLMQVGTSALSCSVYDMITNNVKSLCAGHQGQHEEVIHDGADL